MHMPADQWSPLLYLPIKWIECSARICVVYIFLRLICAGRTESCTVYNFGIMIAHLHVFVVLSLYADHARELLLNFSYAISNYTRGEYLYIYMSAVSIHLYSTLSIDAIIYIPYRHTITTPNQSLINPVKHDNF